MLEAAWINVAMDEVEKAQQTIDMVPEQHPFEMKYEQIDPVEWEDCAEVLSAEEAACRRGGLKRRTVHCVADTLIMAMSNGQKERLYSKN